MNTKTTEVISGQYKDVSDVDHEETEDMNADQLEILGDIIILLLYSVSYRDIPKEDAMIEENDCDCIGWNDNIGIKSPNKDTNTMITYASKASTLSPTVQVIGSSSSTPSFFLSSVISLFIPYWHTKNINILTTQIVTINTCFFITLSIIYILVTSVPFFYYSYNILNFSMFKTMFLCLATVGVLNMSLPVLFCPDTSPSPPCLAKSWPALSLAVLSLLSLLTPILLVILPSHQALYIATTVSKDHNVKEQILLEAESIHAERNTMLTRGKIMYTCTLETDMDNTILVINMEIKECDQALHDHQFLSKVARSQARGVIILDTRQGVHQRVREPEPMLALMSFSICNEAGPRISAV